MIRIEKFKVLKKLSVGQLEITPKRVKAVYTVEQQDGTTASTEMIFSYDQPYFNKKNGVDANLASMMSVQVAMNYGLFCEEIEFDGLFDKVDISFIKNMVENTAREIITNKLLIENEFLKPEFRDLKIGKHILNGHGDNKPTLTYAAQMINRDAKIFVCVDTGETSDVDLYDLIDTPNDIHAGEIETSTTLAIRPEVVDMSKAVDETLDLDNEYLDFTSERGVSWYVHTQRLSKSGVMGNATKANAKKGKKMWEISIAKMVEFVESIKNTPLEKLYQNRY